MIGVDEPSDAETVLGAVVVLPVPATVSLVPTVVPNRKLAELLCIVTLPRVPLADNTP